MDQGPENTMTDLISIIELMESCDRASLKAKQLGLPMLGYLLAMATEEARQSLTVPRRRTDGTGLANIHLACEHECEPS